ncbi:MAG: DUF11 domain-containing protein [Steroidobacteraceae bacterium]
MRYQMQSSIEWIVDVNATLLALILCLFIPTAAIAATSTSSSSFSFNHTGSISTGLVSLLATYNNAETASSSSLTFTRFNPALGRLTQATVTVTTSTSTFAITPTGLLSLISTGSATRNLAYNITAGTNMGGDSNEVVSSGATLLTLLGLGGAEIGGAPLNKSTQFTAAADLARLTGTGTISVSLTATNTFSVSTVASVLNGAGFTGSGTYSGTVTVTYTYTPWSLSGNVYQDLNHSGFKDAGETGTGLTLYAKLVSDSSPTGPALQAVTVDSTTGVYTFGATLGTYRIIINDNSTLSDVTPLVVPPGWTATQATTMLRTGIVFAADSSGQDFGLIHATTLCGRLFKDDGTGGGTANDGILNGTEGGTAAQRIRLLDSNSNVLDTVDSANDGSYCAYIPYTVANGAALRIQRTVDPAYLATGASTGNTTGSYARASDTLSFSNTTAQKYSGVNFGSVSLPTLTGGGEQSGSPSGVLLFGYRLNTMSVGQVTLSTSYTTDVNIAALNTAIYLDANANGRIDNGELPISSPMAVTAGSSTALLLRVALPAALPGTTHAQVWLKAEMSFSNASPSLIYSTSTVSTIDLLTSNATTLQLMKTVDKQNATPGVTLSYTIAFTNMGNSAINNLVISDATPAYTTFLSVAASSIPTELGTATVTKPSIGTKGALQWTFSGQLPPGGSGTLQFSVVVDP